MEQLNFNFGLGGALPKGYTLSSYTFGQAINTIDIESVNIPENVKVILNTFISNDKIMNVPLSNNKALMSYFRIIKKFNVKPKADFLDFLVTREYISEFPDNNPTKESEVAVGILDSYIENTSGQVIIENNSGQVMANGGGVGSFDWANMSFNERVSLAQESGLANPTKVAITEVGMLTPSQISALKNSVRLNKESKHAEGGGVESQYKKGVVLVKSAKASNDNDVWDILNDKWKKYKIVNSRAFDLETPYNRGWIDEGISINVYLLKDTQTNKYYWDSDYIEARKNKMANGGGVKNKKLENIKNRLFAKHKK
jgi:hypothetical protein